MTFSDKLIRAVSKIEDMVENKRIRNCRKERFTATANVSTEWNYSTLVSILNYASKTIRYCFEETKKENWLKYEEGLSSF